MADSFDAVIVGPGGLFPWVTTDSFPANLWGDVPLFGAGLGWALDAIEIRELGARAVSRRMLQRFRWVWTRDAVLGGLATEAGAPTVVAPDIVYSAEVGLSTGAGAKRVAIWPNATCPEVRLGCLAQWLVGRGYEVHAYAASAVSGQLDALQCQALAGSGCRWYPRTLNWIEAIEEIRQAGVVYSARKHPLVLAELFGTPAWGLDVMGALRPMHEVAGGYGRIVGDLGDTDVIFDEGAVLPEVLAAEVPNTWHGQLAIIRERVTAALDALAEQLRGVEL